MKNAVSGNMEESENKRIDKFNENEIIDWISMWRSNTEMKKKIIETKIWKGR